MKINKNIKNCAIIGNSPSLLDQINGEKIDNNDKIIRCNMGIVDGFENFVGSRTDIRLINCHVLKLLQNKKGVAELKKFECLQKYSIVEIISSSEILILKDTKCDKFARKNNIEKTIQQNYNLNNSIYTFNTNAFSKININSTFSAGGHAIALAAFLYPKAQINVYGFSFYESNKTKGCSHYYENVNNKKLGHNYSKEKQVITRMKRVNIL
jgi:hypothetical protein